MTGTATILAGKTTTTVDVPLRRQRLRGDETLNLNLSGAVHGVVSKAQGQVTITEDDPKPTISVATLSVGEGDGTATFTISLDAAAAVDVNVDYATSKGGGAQVRGRVRHRERPPRAPPPLRWMFPSWTTAALTGTETSSLDLSNAANGTLGTPPYGHDAPDVDIAPAQGFEGNSGTTPLDFNVNLSNPSFEDIKVDYVTSDGSATAGSDYAATSSTLTIPAGRHRRTRFEVLVNGDTTFEPSGTSR